MSLIPYSLLLMTSAQASLAPFNIWNDPATKKLRVRIANGVRQIKIHGIDLKLSDSSNLKLENSGSTNWTIECNDKGIIGRRSDSAAEIQWKTPLTIVSKSGFYQANDQLIRESAEIKLSGKFCDLLTELPFEQLVTAKMAEQTTKAMPDSALDAEIIMVRSQLLYSILKQREKSKNDYEIDAPKLLTLNNGEVLKEDYRLQASLKRTESAVLTLGPDAAPEIFQAHSHASCAGKTVTPENAWGRSIPGYKKPIACPACLTAGTVNWNTEIRERELINLMLGGIDHTGVPSQWPRDWNRWFVRARLTGIEIKKRDESNRAQIMTITFAFNEEAKMDFDITASTFKNWIGLDTIKSTRFTVATGAVSARVNRFTFEGQGQGHGVGLCQTGAKSLASSGMNTENILKTYFPAAQIRKL
ncbi:MAG: SpoIID/LytB domain-containing protein [Xanthomonadaceae bacterium]|nr:SpoIID/LytB domain-containing protein [Xanthomonadaceae bacterium]